MEMEGSVSQFFDLGPDSEILRQAFLKGNLRNIHRKFQLNRANIY